MSKDSSTPGQVTYPGDASSGYRTDKDGVIYPKEISRTACEFLAGEGSMGFERNQGVVRDGWNAESPQGGTMGQFKLERLKKSEYGSYGITGSDQKEDAYKHDSTHNGSSKGKNS